MPIPLYKVSLTLPFWRYSSLVCKIMVEFHQIFLLYHHQNSPSLIQQPSQRTEIDNDARGLIQQALSFHFEKGTTL